MGMKELMAKSRSRGKTWKCRICKDEEAKQRRSAAAKDKTKHELKENNGIKTHLERGKRSE